MISKESGKWCIGKLAVTLLLAVACFAGSDLFFNAEDPARQTNIRVAVIMFAAMLILSAVKIQFSEKTSRELSMLFALAQILVFVVLSDEIVNRAVTNAETEAVPTFQKQPICIFFAVFTTLLLFLILLFLINRAGIAASLTSLVLYVLSMAVVMVCDFRGSPFIAADLFTVRTAADVADRYTYDFTFFQYACFCLIVLFGFIQLDFRGTRIIKAARYRLGALAAVLVISACFAKFGVMSDFLKDREININQWKPIDSYRTHGTVTTFLRSIRYAFIEKPEGYSVETIRTLAEKYRSDQIRTGQEDTRPNIIIIVDEAYADLSVLGDFETSEDYMPVYHALEENCVKGYFQSSIVGGGTAKTEYELLTSISDAFIGSNAQPFEMYVRESLPTLPSILNDLGYTGRTAIHPMFAQNYNRKNAYPLLGFEEFMSLEKLPEDMKKVRGLVTDMALYEYVIESYEKSDSSRPFYTYLMTIQNHSPFDSGKKMKHPIKITDKNKDKEAEEYLSLLYESDQALGKLTDYFAEIEDPTVIIMLGDHQPRLPDSFLSSITGGKSDIWTEEESQIRYKTPYVIWANYDIDETVSGDTSANYLQGILLETAGLEETGYQKYLKDLREEIHWINGIGYEGADGKYYSVGDTDSPYYDRVQEYKAVQYNYLFGGKNRVDEFFSLFAY